MRKLASNYSGMSLLAICLGMLCCTPLAAREPLPKPLRLPPGLRQVLPLVKKASYVGDAIRIADCPEDEDNPFGTCANTLFGGPALYDSHLQGFVQIQFFPPVNNIAHFEISHPGNLRGDDALLKAPQLYEFPVQEVFVFDDLSVASSGDLNLLTGEVTNLDYRLNFFNTFYTSFADENPRLAAAAFRFPGIYGNSHVEFTQRADGLLDVSLDGQTFLPLSNSIQGDPVRIPLPLCGALLQCGSIQAPGSSLHPRIHWTTAEPAAPDCGASCPEIPVNTTWIFTLQSRQSIVADRFNLNIPQLGGNRTTARSHMQGRVQIQFGEESGGTVPFVVTLLPPGGLLGKPPESILDALGVTVGLVGHDSTLVFPKQTYHFESVAMSNDPFDLAIGSVDRASGRVVGKLLYRGFFIQTLLLAILEQNLGRIPPASFPYRGPAWFDKGPNGQTVFHFDGDFFLPFAGFTFPSPDFVPAHAFVAGDDSELNPVLRFQAIHSENSSAGGSGVKVGSRTNVLAGIGERFSYTYSIACNNPGQGGAFEYTNHNKAQTFRMENLAAVRCFNSVGSTLPPGDFDTITFSGFGTWTGDDDRHLATVQILTAPGKEYVTIQIDGGFLSNVDTPPTEEPQP